MDTPMTTSNEDRKPENDPVIDRLAVPTDVRLQIAESKHRMAESRYKLAVTRARLWADKLRDSLSHPSVDK